uniref:Uncharacterized protein n=1 Tax=Arundo donax TaxID=35708 RepID=A0A0A9FK71_ARUDO
MFSTFTNQQQNSLVKATTFNT